MHPPDDAVRQEWRWVHRRRVSFNSSSPRIIPGSRSDMSDPDQRRRQFESIALPLMQALYNTSLRLTADGDEAARSEEHTSELQSLAYLVCRLLLEKKQV